MGNMDSMFHSSLYVRFGKRKSVRSGQVNKH